MVEVFYIGNTENLVQIVTAYKIIRKVIKRARTLNIPIKINLHIIGVILDNHILVKGVIEDYLVHIFYPLN